AILGDADSELWRRREIDLRVDDDRLAQARQLDAVFFRQTGRRVDEIENDVRVFRGASRALDADPFDDIRSFAQPRRVGERHRQTTDLDRLAYDVARRAGDRRDDSAIA